MTRLSGEVSIKTAMPGNKRCCEQTIRDTSRSCSKARQMLGRKVIRTLCQHKVKREKTLSTTQFAQYIQRVVRLFTHITYWRRTTIDGRRFGPLVWGGKFTSSGSLKLSMDACKNAFRQIIYQLYERYLKYYN